MHSSTAPSETAGNGNRSRWRRSEPEGQPTSESKEAEEGREGRGDGGDKAERREINDDGIITIAHLPGI